MKKKLDKYHYHEALGRTYLIQEIIETSLQQHAVYKKHKKLKKKLHKAQILLGDCYQKIGNL